MCFTCLHVVRIVPCCHFRNDILVKMMFCLSVLHQIMLVTRRVPLVKQEMVAPSKPMSSSPLISGVRVDQIVAFPEEFCLFTVVCLLSFFFRILYRASFDLRLLIIHLVSSDILFYDHFFLLW